MEKPTFSTENFFKLACGFEGALLVLACTLGGLLDTNPLVDLYFSEKAMVQGIFATLPLLVIFFAIRQLPVRSLLHIQQLLTQTLGVQLANRHWADIFILAAIAGISEEVLFRGFLQPWLENGWGFKVGLIGSNLVFALMHAVTPLYALLALLMGLYMSFFLDYEGERRLLTPIIIHVLYDFVAILVIVRDYRSGKTL